MVLFNTTRVLMFSRNTVIAWYKTYYEQMRYDNKNTLLIASRAYLLQSPTCTRVQLQTSLQQARF